MGAFVGGVSGPLVFGFLVCRDYDAESSYCWGHPSNSIAARWPLVLGYALGSLFMMAAAVAECFLGVSAEGRSLEELAPPLGEAATVEKPLRPVVPYGDMDTSEPNADAP